MGSGYCVSVMVPCLNVAIVVVVITIIVFRIFYVVYWSSKPPCSKARQHVSTLIVLGSGGHTAEMINLVNVLQKERFKPRFYVAATTDNTSLQKARVVEKSLADQKRAEEVIQAAKYMQIYRSREVGQSYLTSVGTTLIAIFHAFQLMIKIRPQVIICNGPGTCIPLCVVAFLLKVAGIKWSSIFYVESIARVRKLSLSGLILYKLCIADELYVQWPQIQAKYPRAHYVGCLM